MTFTTPPDQAARDRAVADLDTNLLVEAGAGSGKTTLMARRVVALLAAGRAADRIAAVTFTRKAAAELRERVQLELEKTALDASLANELFIGTIHSFCARLLRERPVEAGLDPRFREMDQDESAMLAGQWWEGWLERLYIADDSLVRRLRELGVVPRELAEAFLTFVQYPDVDFSAPETPVPDVSPLTTQLSELLKRGLALMPGKEPAEGWDDVQRALRQLRFEQRSRDWSRAVEFFESLALLPPNAKLVQQRWVRRPANANAAKDAARADKAAAKAFGEDLLAWRGAAADAALTAWYEHRYAPAAALLSRASEDFAEYRLMSARLSFEDLLLYAASLLRTDRGARSALGERWRYVLVDEFQDTDPIQAEVLFLLGSEPPAPNAAPVHWSRAALRPGALFVVGDPKQSIYRFRRSDVETYEEAREAIVRQGAHLKLTANFRSLPAIAALVNAHFGGAAGAFPAEATRFQAAYAPLEPMKDATEGASPLGAVLRYAVVGRKGDANKESVIGLDASMVASWVAAEVEAGRIAPRDVLILTRKKEALAEHARQLAARGIPVSVAGAEVPLEAELHELQLLLQLMRDPSNPVLVAAALEGRFFGLSPADLWAAQAAHIPLTAALAPPAEVTNALAAGAPLKGSADVRAVRAPSGEPTDMRAVKVRDALGQLHRWLLRSHTDAPDVFMSRVLDETGLLAYTAASDLGDVRAGLLVRLVEEVRDASLDPQRAGNAAQDALERLLSADIPDAPLLPGRADAVRVMNLHKAKGLEAEIVILAAPTESSPPAPSVAVRREGSRPTGGVLIAKRSGYQSAVVAQPPGWAGMQATEAQFAAAEGERLRYVAATRARSRLIVSGFLKELKDGLKRQDNREWSAFTPTLDAIGVAHLSIAVSDARGRDGLQESAGDVLRRVAMADKARERSARPSWVRQTISESARSRSLSRRTLEDVSAESRGAGAAWGRAVHRALEEIGRSGGGPPLEAATGRIAAEEGIEERAHDLRAIVERVLSGPAWRRLMAAPARRFEWPVAGWEDRDGHSTCLEGVIDAAFQTAKGWHVLDWKTDDVTEAAWAAREPEYQAQVAAYARLLARALDARVTSELVRVL